MFSIITIASSTTNPDAIVSDMSDRLFRLNPSRYMTANVPMSDSGTERLGMIVAGMFRRKTKMTSTTSMTASVSSNSTSRIEARIAKVERGQVDRDGAPGERLQDVLRVGTRFGHGGRSKRRAPTRVDRGDARAMRGRCEGDGAGELTRNERRAPRGPNRGSGLLRGRGRAPRGRAAQRSGTVLAPPGRAGSAWPARDRCATAHPDEGR